MNASAAVRKTLFVFLFLLSVLTLALIQDSDVISNAKNPVPWLVAGFGAFGYQ